APPLVEHAVGQDRAVAQVAGAAQVVVDGVGLGGGGAHAREGLRDDLGADPVPADHSDAVAPCRSIARETRNRPPGGGRSKAHVGSRRALGDDDYRGGWADHRAPVFTLARTGVNCISGPWWGGWPASAPHYSGRPMAQTQHLSQAAFDRLQAEYDDLTTRGRGEIARKIEAARELGDLSENGDYHAAKEEQGKMEGA